MTNLPGAPEWAEELERRSARRYEDLCTRVGALEEKARQGGASAGRRWGAFLGALITLASTFMQSQCVSSADAREHNNANGGRTNHVQE